MAGPGVDALTLTTGGLPVSQRVLRGSATHGAQPGIEKSLKHGGFTRRGEGHRSAPHCLCPSLISFLCLHTHLAQLKLSEVLLHDPTLRDVDRKMRFAGAP